MVPLKQNILKNAVLVFTSIFSFTFCLGQGTQSSDFKIDELNHFIDLIYSKDSLEQSQHLTYISSNWKDEYEIMLLELAYFNFDNDLGVQLMDIINEKSGKNLGYSLNVWYQYLWSKEEKMLDKYDHFKAELYKNIDKRFEEYFIDRKKSSKIRFDEIRWGGVKQDGIPPLRDPKMIKAEDADYLADDNIVFGIEVNGDFRAYPKRILAWHEMFTATVGEEAVTVVYCTLCGTVILYKSTKDGVKYDFGTSGFLFRSNKLMYDQKTQSLWSTVWGEPVIGPLVGKGIQLDYLSTVTTTWGEWRKLHPTTEVLSLNTGYKRDYAEGVAYHDYFANDQIMFAVPKAQSENIKNKQSILAIRLQDDTSTDPVAISVKFLKRHPLYKYNIGSTNLLILTDKTGANRVYDIQNKGFTKYNRSKNFVVDDQGDYWTLHEDHLKNKNGETLKRFEAFNAFWFGWQAAYPNTLLIK